VSETTRRPFIAGNWKMHLDLDGAKALASEVVRLCNQVRDRDIALIPSFPFLAPVADKLRDSRIALGAQDCHTEVKGAFTGAVSTDMLRSVGCAWVLCGHSERRHVFGDTDAVVHAKLRRVLASGMGPILCIGETQAERRGGRTTEVLRTQLTGALDGLDEVSMRKVVIAYEPVWAIGTGDTATPAQAQDAHAFVREWLANAFGDSLAKSIRIQYGGSVKADNAAELMACPDVDGALVGGASLDAGSFAQIVKF
jgi:triosephosphate isomerase